VTARPAHLVARFFGSIVPRPVRDDDRTWSATLLTEPERSLWAKMRRADKVESIGVARRADDELAGGDERRGEYLAAALLHDIGKLDADFGPYRRAIATLAGAIAGRSTVEAWRQQRGFVRRCALYLDHAALGAQRVRVAGGRECVAEWADAHHDAARWPTPGIPLDVCRTLARADGEQVE
jgi:hypothetical protein